MKPVIFFAWTLILLTACGDIQNDKEQIGLRSDGHYAHRRSKIVYLMRFSEKGNVVLTGGHQDKYEAMVKLLDPEIPDQNNVYNVQYVLLPNDSVYFYTVSPKGRISYSGLSFHPDTLRILKKSHINGKEGLLDYYFVPDQE